MPAARCMDLAYEKGSFLMPNMVSSLEKNSSGHTRASSPGGQHPNTAMTPPRRSHLTPRSKARGEPVQSTMMSTPSIWKNAHF